MNDTVPSQRPDRMIRIRYRLYMIRPKLVFRRALGWWDALVSRRDMRRLRAQAPEMERALSPEIIEKERDRLAAVYDQYVSKVSVPDMAISLELAAAMLSLCRILHPLRVVDLGSGFSSFVLRLYARDSASDVVTVSVDDSAEWLSKTRQFLDDHNLDASALVTWSSFRESGEDGFDLVLHDLGGIPLRGRVLPEVLELARPGAILIFDDAHMPRYRTRLRKVVSEAGLAAYNLRTITKDPIRRYSLLVRR